MKAVFIYKDGKQVGNPTGYTTVKGAKKSLVGCEDWYRLLTPYVKPRNDNDIPTEWIKSGIFEWSEHIESYLFKQEVWSRKVWNEYVKEHYEFIEKEYNIDVK